jgi:exosortase B
MAALGAWWPVLVGLLVLYLPTYYGLANGIWNSEEHAHGPIVLAVALFLIWQARHFFLEAPRAVATDADGAEALGDRRPKTGWTLLILGLLFYALGRSQEILLFEVGSQVPVLLGVLLITVGSKAARALWFALFFLLFMVPLPGFVVDSATGPLKQHISEIAEHLLYAAGYPIARSGVTLTVGPYQLLVADACSGLHSMFSLSAMGLLYLYLMGHKSWARNAILIASILPIAFVANVIRVIILVLVTYHFGDEAGQGFVHGFAGIVLFVVALLILFALDGVLGMVFKMSATQLPAPAASHAQAPGAVTAPAPSPIRKSAGKPRAMDTPVTAPPAAPDRDLAMECRRQSFLLHYDPGEKDAMEWLVKVADTRGWN